MLLTRSAVRASWLVAVIHICIHSTGAVNNTLTVIPEIQYAVNGSYANFTCSPKVGYAYWVINGRAANSAHTSVQQMLVDEGYIFNDSDWSLTVSVPARELTNNTVIRCRGLSQGYSINNASLIVVDPTPPLSPIISIEDVSSSSSVIISWFQPLLWPESDTNFNQVAYYNITVTVAGESDEHLEEHMHVIINYTNATGSIDIASVECRVSVWISAVNEYGASNRTLTTRSIPKVPGAFLSDGIEISTYFDSRGTPIIPLYINPPRLCSFQQFNYSIIIKDNEAGPHNEVLRVGPKEGQPTDDTIQEMITSGLKRDAQYSARVVIDTELESITSDEVVFSTHLYLNDQNPIATNSSCDNGTYLYLNDRNPNCSCDNTDKALYLSVMGASIGLSTFILLSVIVALMLCILCSRYGRRENSQQTNKPLSSMVHNPIYDGPIYESVIQDFNTLQSSTSEAVASAHTNDSKPQESPPPDNNSVRYLDEPIQPRMKVDNARSSSCHSRALGLTTRSASVSIPSKRTTQERNKLQLTLSLGSTAALPSNMLGERKNRENGVMTHSLNGSAVTIHHPTAPKFIPAIAIVSSQDENYTVMSPAGTRTAMLGSLENGFGELSPEDTEKYRE